ncbi:MAG: hypothetical protein LBR33_04005 [Propionibacteriaceae bacterium]|jgi:hypothetical protein|nr:hypothetical protein [Propionibacteriaceae bacterium]
MTTRQKVGVACVVGALVGLGGLALALVHDWADYTACRGCSAPFSTWVLVRLLEFGLPALALSVGAFVALRPRR